MLDRRFGTGDASASGTIMPRSRCRRTPRACWSFSSRRSLARERASVSAGSRRASGMGSRITSICSNTRRKLSNAFSSSGRGLGPLRAFEDGGFFRFVQHRPHRLGDHVIHLFLVRRDGPIREQAFLHGQLDLHGLAQIVEQPLGGQMRHRVGQFPDPCVKPGVLRVPVVFQQAGARPFHQDRPSPRPDPDYHRPT